MPIIVSISADFSDLYSGKDRTADRADVLNGISVAEDPDLLYITGKKWDRMFLVRYVFPVSIVSIFFTYS